MVSNLLFSAVDEIFAPLWIANVAMEGEEACDLHLFGTGWRLQGNDRDRLASCEFGGKKRGMEIRVWR